MAEREQLAEWLSATARGDEQAFQRLYAATSSQLYGLLPRILRNPERAQDALQDAYVRVWQKADTYAPERGAPLTWLLSIARYRALDVLRRKRPEVAMPNKSQNKKPRLQPQFAWKINNPAPLMCPFPRIRRGTRNPNYQPSSTDDVRWTRLKQRCSTELEHQWNRALDHTSSMTLC